MIKVHMMRAGLPDKPMMMTSGNYALFSHNYTDLRNYSYDEIKSEVDKGNYFIPIVESDISYCNELYEKGMIDQSHIILPQGNGKVIDFHKFVEKDSEFYKGIDSNTKFHYPYPDSYDIDEFTMKFNSTKDIKPCAIKVQVGGGSRGVVVYNPDYWVPNTREQVTELTMDHLDDVIHHAKVNNCKILVQDLCRVDLSKYNCNFIMRDGKLLVYKWEHPDNPSTNWDWGKFIRTKFTDEYVNSLVNYLVSCGVTDGIFGMDGYTNYEDYADICEINFRCENCMFTFECFNIDYIDCYINKSICQDLIPMTEGTEGIPYVRYWRACLMDRLPNFSNSK